MAKKVRKPRKPDDEILLVLGLLASGKKWAAMRAQTGWGKATIDLARDWFLSLSEKDAKDYVSGRGDAGAILRLRVGQGKEEAGIAQVEEQAPGKPEGPVAGGEDRQLPRQPSTATDGEHPEAAALVPQRIEIPMRGAIRWLSTYVVGYSRTLRNGEEVSGAIAWNRPWTWGWRLEVYDPLGNRAQTWEGTQTRLPFSFVASLNGEYHLRVTNLGDVYTATGTMEITPPGWRQTMG